jgi:hypothetical protein
MHLGGTLQLQLRIGCHTTESMGKIAHCSIWHNAYAGNIVVISFLMPRVDLNLKISAEFSENRVMTPQRSIKVNCNVRFPTTFILILA